MAKSNSTLGLQLRVFDNATSELIDALFEDCGLNEYGQYESLLVVNNTRYRSLFTPDVTCSNIARERFAYDANQFAAYGYKVEIFYDYALH